MKRLIKSYLKWLALAWFTAAFLACDPCEKFKHEIYEPEIYSRFSDSAKAKFLSDFLKNFQEPDLRYASFESYRYVHKHVFEDTLHIVRIENRDLKNNFVYKKIVRQDTSLRIVEVVEKELPKQIWKEIEQSIYQNNYWTLPKEIDRYGLDGGWWEIEGRRPEAEICGKRRHHTVSRWSPEAGAFRNLCDKFDELAMKMESKK